MGELALELTRRPAGVAERDKALVGAALVADVAQDLAARCHGDVAVDVEGVGAMIVGAVEDKADVRLHWAPGEDANRSRNARVILAERLEEPRQRPISDRPIDDDAERAIAIMPHHQDHRLQKARIAHGGRSDQKLPG